jgi:hypothetical protein
MQSSFYSEIPSSNLVPETDVQNKVSEAVFSTLKESSWYYMKLAHDRYITHRSQFVID